MTLIEVLVAAVVLVLAALATFGVLTAATRNAQRAQATQVALDKAQGEIEKLHTLKYSELALTTTPDYADAPKNPNHRISGGEFALRREPFDEYAQMVVNGGSIYGGGFVTEGKVTPGPIAFREGNVSGKLYRYVVWRNDPSCPESVNGAEDFCPGGQDYKQIVVAAQLDRPGGESGERGYVEVQSQVVNPATKAQRSTQGGSSEGGGGGGGGGEDETEGLNTGKAVTAQQFFLSDTPCAAAGTTVRQGIAGDHLLHNTLGTCADGLQTGSTNPGAPDALLLGGPPDPDPEDELNPGFYDYSSDSYLEPPTGTDTGLQLVREDTPGCHFDPTGTVYPEAKTHRWVTDSMPKAFTMNGIVTLEFYSRTLNEASYPATLCVFLFRLHEGESPELLQSKLGGAPYWTYASQGTESWPRTSWTRLRLTMEFVGAPLTIAEGDRLGVALSVDPANTPEKTAIQIMYDHPNYPTRIEVDTTTPLEGS